MDGEALFSELDRLAALNPIAYELERAAIAERFGIRVSALDRAVDERKPKPEAAMGRTMVIEDVKPWDERVGAAALLNELVAAIRRHVILAPETADAIALWIAHTWVADRFEHTPRLAISSPAKRCGKSTLLDVLRATCCRVLKADNISAAAVYRTVEAMAPVTLLLDEADAFLGENEELRGVLNCGFQRGGQAIRVQDVGGELQPVAFNVFAPVALAGIGAMPGTLEDRSVPVSMRRKGAGETAIKLRAPGARAALANLSRKLARWATDRGGVLALDPLVPDEMGDREGDICVSLLSVADDAGNGWPERARAALLSAFRKRDGDGGNVEHGALLLADLRNLFNEKGATRLETARVIEELGGMEERPWPEWRQGKPMTATQLARALAPFGVRPQTIRFEGESRVAKGYYRDTFADAWTRYLAPVDGRKDR